MKMNKPAFAMTVTYCKSKVFKRPLMEVYLDGPFYAEGETVKDKTADLHIKVSEAMMKRSKNSNYDYIKYEKKEISKCEN